MSRDATSYQGAAIMLEGGTLGAGEKDFAELRAARSLLNAGAWPRAFARKSRSRSSRWSRSHAEDRTRQPTWTGATEETGRPPERARAARVRRGMMAASRAARPCALATGFAAPDASRARKLATSGDARGARARPPTTRWTARLPRSELPMRNGRRMEMKHMHAPCPVHAPPPFKLMQE